MYIMKLGRAVQYIYLRELKIKNYKITNFLR